MSLKGDCFKLIAVSTLRHEEAAGHRRAPKYFTRSCNLSADASLQSHLLSFLDFQQTSTEGSLQSESGHFFWDF
jgi:hypothetical protein